MSFCLRKMNSPIDNSQLMTWIASLDNAQPADSSAFWQWNGGPLTEACITALNAATFTTAH